MQKFKLGESSQHDYLDGGVVVVDEVVLDVLQSEGGLAHAPVPQHHDAVPAADVDQTDTNNPPPPNPIFGNKRNLYIGWRLRSRRKKRKRQQWAPIYDLPKISIINMVFNSFHQADCSKRTVEM